MLHPGQAGRTCRLTSEEVFVTNRLCPTVGSGGNRAALVAGFVNACADLTTGAVKALSLRLQARMIAVRVWDENGERSSHKALADNSGVSKRWLSKQFADHHSLYAFPPPELAYSLTGATAGVREWAAVAQRTWPVFAALETNPTRTIEGGTSRRLIPPSPIPPSLVEAQPLRNNRLTRTL
jgi:hypothetical protein